MSYTVNHLCKKKKCPTLKPAQQSHKNKQKYRLVSGILQQCFLLPLSILFCIDAHIKSRYKHLKPHIATLHCVINKGNKPKEIISHKRHVCIQFDSMGQMAWKLLKKRSRKCKKYNSLRKFLMCGNDEISFSLLNIFFFFIEQNKKPLNLIEDSVHHRKVKSLRRWNDTLASWHQIILVWVL